MTLDHFVKRRKHPKYLAKVEARKRAGNGGVNDCFRPSADVSKADLAEYHRENMGLRRAHQLARTPNVRLRKGGSIATGNRRGGEHKHEREIARRKSA